MSVRRQVLGRWFVVVASLVALATPAAAAGGPGAADWRLFPRQRRTVARCYVPPAQGPVRVAMFDADSTLRVSWSGSPSANGVQDVALLPLVAPKLKQLAAEGWLIAVVSNQGGVEKGMVTFAVADGGLRFACRQLARLGAPVHCYDFAEAYDRCRKPDVGMAENLAATVKAAFGREIDWAGSMMVGDSGYKKGEGVQPDGRPAEDVSDADRLFADAVRARLAGGKGLPWHHPRDFFGWVAYGVRNFEKVGQLEAFVAKHPELDPGLNVRPAK